MDYLTFTIGQTHFQFKGFAGMFHLYSKEVYVN